MFSLLLFIFCWLWATPPTALTIPPPLPILAAPESYWPMSLRIKFLRFLISSTYCINASLFFYIICWDFSLQMSISSKLLRDKPELKFICKMGFVTLTRIIQSNRNFWVIVLLNIFKEDLICFVLWAQWNESKQLIFILVF
jgi:hypothetical protein